MFALQILIAVFAYGSKEFINIARNKLEDFSNISNFYLSGDCEVELTETVDMIINMFSSFNYKTKRDYALKALRNHAYNLTDNGILAIDFLNKDHFIKRFHEPCKNKDKNY